MGQVMVFKTTDRVYVATTSQALLNASNNANVNNRLQWVPENCKNTIMALPGSFPRSPLLRTMENIVNEDGFGNGNGITKEYLMTQVVGKIIHELQTFGGVNPGKVDKLNLNLVIASKNKAYFLGNNGNIRVLPEICNYPVSNAYFVASMNSLKDVSNIDYRMVLSFYYGSISEINLDYPIVINDTYTMTPRLYFKKDIDEIVLKYEKGEI